MSPLVLRILYVVEAGSVVILLGKDADTGADTTVWIDQRPFEAVWRDLKKCAQYVGYTAHGLSVELAFDQDASVQAGG